MKVKYHTEMGSVYIRTVTDAGQYWVKESANGTLESLAGGVHIKLLRLQELIDEYPRTLLDKTFCFTFGAEQEFLDDAKREAWEGPLSDEATVIFFLIKVNEHYAMGCSSKVVQIEKVE